MEKGQKTKNSYSLWRSFGWKRNLMAIVAGAALNLFLDKATTAASVVRVISQFDFSIAIMPLVGFLLAGWGVLGFVVVEMTTTILGLWMLGFHTMGALIPFALLLAGAMFIDCALPSILWHAWRLKGEEKVEYPRFDTSAHVFKYYLIMIITVTAYVVVCMFAVRTLQSDPIRLSEWLVTILQYLDAVLFIGIPAFILISVIRNRTVTINERMVLAFLVIGAIAAVLAVSLVYHTIVRLDPDFFSPLESSVARGTGGADLDEYWKYIDFWDWFAVMIAVFMNILLIIEMLFMHSIEKK